MVQNVNINSMLYKNYGHVDEGNQRYYGVASMLYSAMHAKLATWLQVSGHFID